MKRLHCATLALTVLLLSILTAVGCSKPQDTPNNDKKNPSVSQTASDGTTSWADTIPSNIKYDGQTFNIGWINALKLNECSMSYEESSGDVVDEAVYKRNSLTEAKLNISITADMICDDWEETEQAVEKLILSNDATYDVYAASTWQLFKCSLKGYLIPVRDITSLNISNPWWDSELIKMTALGSSTYYLLNGHINYNDDYGCATLYFNKVLCTDLGLEHPYGLVRNGEWTLDKLIEYVNTASDDLDGDGDFDENDRYGLTENSGILARFLPSLNENVIIFDSEGNASLNESESFVSKVDKIYDQLLGINNNPVLIVERKLGYEVGNKVFPQGNSLFYGSYVLSMISYRKTMDNDFGVVPFPKYDEAQNSYYSAYDTAYGTSYAVPITNNALERTGWVLETMGFYSTDTVYPASIDVNVMTKMVRDDDSAEMLKIIFDNKFYELGQLGTTIYSQLISRALSGKINIASMIAKFKNVTANEFAAVKDYYEFD